MKTWLEGTLLALFTVFAPLKAAIIVVANLVIIDLILGIMGAHKRKEPITSSGLKTTVGKILLYEVSLCIAFLVETYLTGDLFPACKLVAALIGLVELKSILENLDEIHGASLFSSLITKITNKSKDLD